METASNLTGIAIVALTALGCGLVMARLRQPALVGYLLAGVVLGPTGLGLVRSREEIGSLAELGVLLLLFVVGMELNVRTLRPAWRLALGAVAMQVTASLAVMFGLSTLLGLPTELAILLGFVVALSSTAVSVKLMEEADVLRARVGRVTVAVLIAQDLAFLPMILVVTHLDGSGFGIVAVGQIAVAVALLVVLVRVLLRRRNLNLPFAHIFVGRTDLSPLTGLVYCFGAGALFGLMGLSAAYGAFLAGLFIGNSAQRRQMIGVVRPIESVLVMVFFLSIGLLIDLGFIWRNLATVLLVLGVVTLFKTALNIWVQHVLGETWPRAFLEGLLMSQLGEFGFVLATTGLALGAIDAEGGRLVIAVTVLSLALSPLWLATARRMERFAATRIATLGEVLDFAYGKEAQQLRDLGDRAGTRMGKLTQRARAARARRRQRRAAARSAASADAEAATPDVAVTDIAVTDAAVEDVAAETAGADPTPAEAAPSPGPETGPETGPAPDGEDIDIPETPPAGEKRSRA